jgi:A/G-specific adenine glycosylase
MEYYRSSGRRLPWRETADPYGILVSEFMLQQTQIERVLGKFGEFLGEFPCFDALAGANLDAVLRAWQGLGYNRRALALRETARKVASDHGGALPETREALLGLPGIGQSTAGAILAFAFGNPVPFIETNIRRVFLHFFFPCRDRVKDSEILPLVEETLDREDPRRWYYALMDYGTMLKKSMPNPNRKSAHYTRQPPFEGSDRQIRGLILRELVSRGPMEAGELVKGLGKDPVRIYRILGDLVREGFLARSGGTVSVA